MAQKIREGNRKLISKLLRWTGTVVKAGDDIGNTQNNSGHLSRVRFFESQLLFQTLVNMQSDILHLHLIFQTGRITSGNAKCDNGGDELRLDKFKQSGTETANSRLHDRIQWALAEQNPNGLKQNN